MIDVTPDPIALQLGPISIGWYGLLFAAALTAGVLVAQREAARKGEDPRNVLDGLLLVVLLTVVGARLYHVIDQWAACDPGPCYSQNLAAIVLPPYSGLGLYGGIAGAVVGLYIYTRRRGLSFLRYGDIGVPGLLIGQAIARWGNFFNQELYGPPTDLPWGIAIQCANRVQQYACPPGSDPEATLGQGFHPLFFYEAALTLTGGLLALYLARRFGDRLRDGDLVSFWFIWYGAVRGLLEIFREGYNWTFFGVPMAIIIGAVAIAVGVATIIRRHRRTKPGEPVRMSSEPATPPAPAD
ncbi:prolipoprotein diacylglyceryl transferase [soil metagenome]